MLCRSTLWASLQEVAFVVWKYAFQSSEPKIETAVKKIGCRGTQPFGMTNTYHIILTMCLNEIILVNIIDALHYKWLKRPVAKLRGRSLFCFKLKWYD